MKSYTHFTLEERKCLEQSLKEHKSIRAIAREITVNEKIITMLGEQQLCILFDGAIVKEN